jgi:hypothetical protein
VQLRPSSSIPTSTHGRALQVVADSISCYSSFSCLLLTAGGRSCCLLASGLVSPHALQLRQQSHVASRPCTYLYADIDATTQVSKLMPPSSSMIVRTLQQDRYYAPLLVLTVPVTIAAVSPCPDDHTALFCKG